MVINIHHDCKQSRGDNTPTKPSKPDTNNHRGHDSCHDSLWPVSMVNHPDATTPFLGDAIQGELHEPNLHQLIHSNICRPTFLPTHTFSYPLDIRHNTTVSPISTNVPNESIRQYNPNTQLHEPSTTNPKQTRNSHTSRNRSSHERDEGNKNRAGMVRGMPYHRPKGAIR